MLESEVTRLDGRVVAIIRFPEKMRALSSTLCNGGYVETGSALMIEVEKGYDGKRPDLEMRESCRRLGLPDDTLCFMTAADIRAVLTTVEESYDGVRASAVVTAGVVNAVTAGDLLPEKVLASLNGPGTINIVAVVDSPLEPSALANAIITITEAKAAALAECGVPGTGTTSDAVAIVCPEGKGSDYAGTATAVGIAISRAVRKAVTESVRRSDFSPDPPTMLSRLEEKGITLEDMWASAKGIYYPNPAWPEEMVRERFLSHLRMLDSDVNVNAMVQAAVLMEEQGAKDAIHGLQKGEFKDDPVHLLADELIAIALAEYIAGTRGLFEYTRYDRRKPGILARLGPFLDDIVGALIGGTMSKVQTDLLGAGR